MAGVLDQQAIPAREQSVYRDIVSVGHVCQSACDSLYPVVRVTFAMAFGSCSGGATIHVLYHRW
jgi:hypothetical protein